MGEADVTLNHTDEKPPDTGLAPGEDSAVVWSHEVEVCLFHAMIGHKPVGVNRHFHMICIRDKFSQNIGRQVSSSVIWDHLGTMYDMQALHESEILPFPNSEKSFSLPDDIIQEVKEGKMGSEEDSKDEFRMERESPVAHEEGSNSSIKLSTDRSTTTTSSSSSSSSSTAAATANNNNSSSINNNNNNNPNPPSNNPHGNNSSKAEREKDREKDTNTNTNTNKPGSESSGVSMATAPTATTTTTTTNTGSGGSNSTGSGHNNNSNTGSSNSGGNSGSGGGSKEAEKRKRSRAGAASAEKLAQTGSSNNPASPGGAKRRRT